ncbi:hypothetical protein [Sphingomonas turrisvirgatae]|uniref:Uncharacterized protein n=1 Tax=Sphingomonas turrisvirgatae TaxID=1888892 RepID=A0A1E3LRZ7_9SPHN|nr:hypothetical protein [Sphingomonas turrisvirgatae]ODP36494.1 hypothetical protein BFL28_05770 [Sphingomonas turrisvirgatae]
MKRSAIALMLLTACSAAAPEGQVAARVDGIEITDRELLSEAEASGVDLANPATRAAVLERVIDRKLLARAGQAAMTDRVPAVQIETRRAREGVLARAYARRVTADVAPPAADAIDRFMRENSHWFARRASYVVDRLSTTAAIAEPASAAAAAQALDRSAQTYRRALVLIDSSTLDTTGNARLAALAPGQTLRSVVGGVVTIDTLLLTQPVVEASDVQRARARTILTQSRSTAAVNTAVRGLRAESDIALRQARR